MEDVNTKQKLFRVIYANTCPNCGHDTLAVVESDWSIHRLNDLGYIKSSRTETSMDIQCINCSEIYPAEKVGMTYKIKPTVQPIRKAMEDFNPFQSRGI